MKQYYSNRNIFLNRKTILLAFIFRILFSINCSFGKIVFLNFVELFEYHNYILNCVIIQISYYSCVWCLYFLNLKYIDFLEQI